MYARIRPRRGTKGQFEAVNPVLKEGEMAIETDDNGTGKGLVNIKFGDGVTDYKSLPYAVRGKDISDTPAVFEDDTEFIEDEEILSGMAAGRIFKLIKKKLSLLTTELANTLSIAQGKNRSHVFQTEKQLDEWLLNADNVATLKIGDNLYIVELSVPDYWWDGTQKQRLETVKVDLNEYYNKEEVDAKDQSIIGMLSDEFSTEKTYAIGELFIYNNKIYKVTSAIEHPGEFDLDYVEEVTLSGALNQSLYNLDYDNMELVSFRATGDTYTVPKNGILTGTWRSSLSADGTVGILSDKRQNDYIHLESKPAGQYYTHFEYIVNIGEILTCKYFQNVDSAVVGYFIPFK